MRSNAQFAVRVRFVKRGKVRFISHRDVARAFERALRVAELPLAFTEGFSPRPRVSFGLALSVGHESDAEYLDLELTEPVDLGVLPGRLTAALPEGMPVTGAVRLAEGAPALQEAVTAVAYLVVPYDGDGRPVPHDVLASAATRALARDALAVTRIRKGREGVDDIRPAIRTIELVAWHHTSALGLTLATQPRGVRPGEVLDALRDLAGVELSEGPVLRTAQWIERAGARLEPLEADAFAHALEARAS